MWKTQIDADCCLHDQKETKWVRVCVFIQKTKEESGWRFLSQAKQTKKENYLIAITVRWVYECRGRWKNFVRRVQRFCKLFALYVRASVLDRNGRSRIFILEEVSLRRRSVYRWLYTLRVRGAQRERRLRTRMWVMCTVHIRGTHQCISACIDHNSNKLVYNIQRAAAYAHTRKHACCATTSNWQSMQFP